MIRERINEFMRVENEKVKTNSYIILFLIKFKSHGTDIKLKIILKS